MSENLRVEDVETVLSPSDGDKKTGSSPVAELKNCLPEYLKQIFCMEKTQIQNTRTELTDFRQQGIDIDSKLLKAWLATKDGLEDAGFSSADQDDAQVWLENRIKLQSNALQDKKHALTSAKEDLGSLLALTGAIETSINGLIAKLKLIPSEDDELQKEKDRLDALIKAAKAGNAPAEIVDSLQTDLDNLDKCTLNCAIEAKLCEWRNARKASEVLIVGSADTEGIQTISTNIAQLEKEIGYMNTYADAIKLEWLKNNCKSA